MKIVFDATGACDESGAIVSGIARATFEILRVLWNDPGSHHITFYVSPGFGRHLKTLGPIPCGCCVVYHPKTSVPFFTRHVWMPFLLRRHDRWISPSGHLPYLNVQRPVVFLHDICIFTHPEWFPESSVESWQTRKGVPRTFERAECVISVSRSTKERAEARFPSLQGKVRVAALGVRPLILSREETDRILHSYAFPEDILLTIATMEPRKNARFLLDGFSRFLKDHPSLAATTVLVWAGGPGWKQEDVRQQIEELNQAWRDVSPRGVVRVLESIDEETKWALYARARAHLLVSHDEGFGLPALEAMSVGCPSIISDIPALTEVAGGASQVVALGDVERLSFAMSQCVLFEEVRAIYAKEGKRRSVLFSWEKTVRDLFCAMENVEQDRLTSPQKDHQEHHGTLTEHRG